MSGQTFARGPSRWVILVHGGAGDIDGERIPAHAAGCLAAAEVGAGVLRKGGSALDAVEAAVCALEDDPKFNAGTGACLNEEGDVELDASIMEGTSMRAGGVAALPPFKNPIAIARAVLEDGKHVLYASEGAARFASAHGFSPSTQDELRTEHALKRWHEVKANRAVAGWAGGTVGAVACDVDGHVASATSTGGMMDKRVGRVGDSPVIGAGTYADDACGAVSTTGKGESFMRTCFALRLVDAIDPGDDQLDLGQLAHQHLLDMNARVGGDGGTIVVDAAGRCGFARITKTMSWGLVRDAGDGIEEKGSGA
jgi:beta-aspartyl-peptidase (threonine type)